MTNMVAGIYLNHNARVYRSRVTPTSVWSLASTYFFAACLVFFAVRGSFSFDYVSLNNPMSGSGSLVGVGTGEGSALHSVELLSVYLIIAAFLIARHRTVLTALKAHLPILLLPLCAVLSAVWSQDPLRSFVFGLFALLNTLFGIYLARCLTQDRQLRLFAFTGVVCALSCALLVLVMPKAGIDYKTASEGWQGIFPHKNICALVMLLLLPAPFLISARPKPSSLTKTLYGVLALGVIALTQSRTGWLCGAALVAFWVTFQFLKKFGKTERFLMVISLIGVVCAVSLLAVNYLPDLLLLLGKSSNLTGRTGVWEAIMPALWKRPLTGFGYSAFWIGFKGEAANIALSSGYAGINNAENGVLQLWLELGLVGVGILGSLLVQSFRSAIKLYGKTQSSHYLWCCSILFLTFLSLVNGNKFMFPHSIEWTMFVIAYVSLRAERRSLQKPAVTGILQTSISTAAAPPAIYAQAGSN